LVTYFDPYFGTIALASQVNFFSKLYSIYNFSIFETVHLGELVEPFSTISIEIFTLVLILQHWCEFERLNNNQKLAA
jgi:hypothetical protein